MTRSCRLARCLMLIGVTPTGSRLVTGGSGSRRRKNLVTRPAIKTMRTRTAGRTGRVAWHPAQAQSAAPCPRWTSSLASLEARTGRRAGPWGTASQQLAPPPGPQPYTNRSPQKTSTATSSIHQQRRPPVCYRILKRLIQKTSILLFLESLTAVRLSLNSTIRSSRPTRPDLSFPFVFTSYTPLQNHQPPRLPGAHNWKH